MRPKRQAFQGVENVYVVRVSVAGASLQGCGHAAGGRGGMAPPFLHRGEEKQYELTEIHV